MDSRFSGPEADEPWADPLRREAAATRPAFSEERHARIMAALHQPGAAAPTPAARKSRVAFALLLSAAATVLAALGVAWWQRGQAPQVVERPAPLEVKVAEGRDALDDVRAMAEAPDRTAEQLDILVESTHSRRWAYLDHDARVATQLLMEQLPLDMLASGDRPAGPDDL